MRNSCEPLIPLNGAKLRIFLRISKDFPVFFFITCAFLGNCAGFCTYFFAGRSILLYSSGDFNNFIASLICLS